MTNLSDFFKLVAEEKKKQEEEFKSLVGEDIGNIIEDIFPKKSKKKNKIKVVKNDNVGKVQQDIPQGSNPEDHTPEFTPAEQKELNGYLNFLEYSTKNLKKEEIVEENKNTELI